MKNRKFANITMAVFAGAVFFSGCSRDARSSVGISMPTRSSERWISDGENVRAGVEALGFRGILQFGDDIVENQVAQIENMITQGVSILVIAPIDGEALTSVLEMANNSKIPVIAYDRLIRNSPYVDYYVSFDNYRVGMQMGDIMVRGLDLANANPANPRFIEVFGGSPDDNNAYFFYDGAMDVLQPFFDSGTLIIGSGQQGMNVAGTLRWDGAVAQARMDNLLSAFYTSRLIDGVLSPYDGISIGIISSLRGVGYGSGDMTMPIVGGQDGELASVRAILDGYQYATIFKDTRSLASAAVEMIAAIRDGKPVQVNNTADYGNGAFRNGAPYIVPSMLLESTPIFRENVIRILVEESGFYTLQDLGL